MMTTLGCSRGFGAKKKNAGETPALQKKTPRQDRGASLYVVIVSQNKIPSRKTFHFFKVFLILCFQLVQDNQIRTLIELIFYELPIL